jgi:hypothetical protein
VRTFVGVVVALDGLVDPEALVVEDGNVLQITGNFAKCRSKDFEDEYQQKIEIAQKVLMEPDSSAEQKRTALKSLTYWNACRTAEYKSLETIRETHKSQWNTGTIRIPLKKPCQNKIRYCAIVGGGTKLTVHLRARKNVTI